MITAQQLTDALRCPYARAAQWVDALNKAMDRFDINTPQRQAAFLAQVGHESAQLSAVVENLNYSADGLLRTFPKHFDANLAGQYARRPPAIANRVYANRLGNGNEASGDGWKYRGRGLIQITFRDNYKSLGDALGLPLDRTPDALLQPGLAALSAAWYWKQHGCNELADKGDIANVTRAINGGYNGLDQRIALYQQASTALA